jgi:hypothetical protein
VRQEVLTLLAPPYCPRIDARLGIGRVNLTGQLRGHGIALGNAKHWLTLVENHNHVRPQLITCPGSPNIKGIASRGGNPFVFCSTSGAVDVMKAIVAVRVKSVLFCSHTA